MGNIKPPFRWLGGKGRLIKHYSPYMPSCFGKYYEPFFGGGAMFFHLYSQGLISSACINDCETPLINALRWIKDDVDAVIGQLSGELSGYSHTRSEYESRRKRYNDMADSRVGLEAAGLFLFLSRTCFNGVMRYNQSNLMNVNVGKINFDDPLSLVREDQLRDVSAALQKVDIFSSGFEDVVAMAKPGDFVYADPPYHPLPGKKSFVGYNQKKFGIADQGALAALCMDAANRGVYVLVSNSGTELIKSLYSSSTFELVDIMAARFVNSKGCDRKPVKEYLIVSRNHEKVA